MTSKLHLGLFGLVEIEQVDAKSHAADNKEVKNETGNRIPIWRPFVLRNWP